MTREWVENEICKAKEENISCGKKLRKLFLDFFKNKELIEYIMNLLNDTEYYYFSISMASDIENFMEKHNIPQIENENDSILGPIYDFLDKHDTLIELYHERIDEEKIKYAYERLCDSDPLEIDGDLIITDPGYVINDNNKDNAAYPCENDFYTHFHYKEDKSGNKYKVYSPEDYPDYISDKNGKPYSATMEIEHAKYEEYRDWYYNTPHDDWSRCECGDNMAAIGLTKSISRGTLYGDWSCTVFDEITNTPIGHFCADAGMVAVFDLKQLLEYNPGFDEYKTKDWAYAYIKDFKGKVYFEILKDEYKYKGKKCHDYHVEVVGDGINRITGELIKFRSKQTGF